MIKRIINSLKDYWNSVYISSRFLIIMCFICFIAIASSIFIYDLDATNNMVTIRTAFSSIIGFLLETSTRKIICSDKGLLLRNYIVGIISLLIVIILILAFYISVPIDNPSLLMLKNTLFSCIGFLISCSEKCNSES